jgi:GTP-binding protein
MRSSVCHSCRSILRRRLQQQIIENQQPKRQRSDGAPSQKIQSLYHDTVPPSPQELSAASWFFKTYRPQKLWTANEWRRDDHNSATSETLIPEVVFLGRSNAGKSSLLNALLDDPTINKVGASPGKTKVAHAYGLSEPSFDKADRVKPKLPADLAKQNLLTVLDAPGYGFASQADWGADMIKYLKERKHLRRVFMLLPARHGIKPGDEIMIKLLRSLAIPHQIILTKCDGVNRIRLEDILRRVFATLANTSDRKTIQPLGEILTVGWLGDGKLNKKVQQNTMQGVDSVRWAVIRAVGLDKFVRRRFSEVRDASQYSDAPVWSDSITWGPPEQEKEDYAKPSKLPITPVVPSTPPIQGIGVSTGIDAFLSAVQKPNDSSSKGARARSPRDWRQKARSRISRKTKRGYSA